MYNYYEEIKSDITDAIVFGDYDNIIEAAADDDDRFNNLYDAMWIDDSITGNGSGSYTFNRSKAKEYVIDNMALLNEMAYAFGIDREEIANKIIGEEWEWLDVSIRCYLLSECMAEVLEAAAFDQ